MYLLNLTIAFSEMRLMLVPTLVIFGAILHALTMSSTDAAATS